MNAAATTRLLHTAGQRVAVEGAPDAVRAVIAATGGAETACPDLPNLVPSLEESRRPFDTDGCEPITRGAWATDRDEAIIESIGGSGYSQLWCIDEDGLRVSTRWTPTVKEAAAARLLP